MKKLVIFLLSLLLLTSCNNGIEPSIDPPEIKDSFNVGLNYKNYSGYDYTCFIPESFSTSTKLVLLLHPGYSSGNDFYSTTNISKYASENNFIVISPSVISGTTGAYWAWYTKEASSGTSPQIKSIKAIVDHVEEVLNVSGTNIIERYLLGFSAGACQSLNMYAVYNDFFDGVCSVAGLPYGVVSNAIEGNALMKDGQITSLYNYNQDFYKSMSFSNVNMLLFHGDNDSTVDVKNSDEILNQFSNVIDFIDDGEVNESLVKTIDENEISTVTNVTSSNNFITYYKYKGVGHSYGTVIPSWYSTSISNYTDIFVDTFIK